MNSDGFSFQKDFVPLSQNKNRKKLFTRTSLDSVRGKDGRLDLCLTREVIKIRRATQKNCESRGWKGYVVVSLIVSIH